MRLYGAAVLDADAEVLRHRAVLDYALMAVQMQQAEMAPPEEEDWDG